MLMLPLNTIKSDLLSIKSFYNLVHYIKELGSRLQRNIKNMHVWTIFHKESLNMALQHGFLKMLGKKLHFLFSFGV